MPMDSVSMDDPRQSLITHLLDAGLDACLELHQPLLHLTSGLGRTDDVRKGNDLALARPHGHHLQVVAEVQGVHALEAFLEVGLYPWVA